MQLTGTRSRASLYCFGTGNWRRRRVHVCLELMKFSRPALRVCKGHDSSRAAIGTKPTGGWSDFFFSRWTSLLTPSTVVQRSALRPTRPLITDQPFFGSITLSDVVLRVRSLESMLSFYHDLLGLRIVTQSAERIGLSPNGEAPALIVLELSPEARLRPSGSSGLFHAAVLYPDRGALGRIAQKLLARRVRFGTGDHGVSEALYLDDPEGNGVELYADRPPEIWPKASGAGDVIGMYTEAVDLGAVVQAGEKNPGPLLPTTTRLGHIHLNVANLAGTERFYRQLLGFEVMVRSIPGALFLGRDGYHHHLGTNVWQSRAPAAEGALGLARFTLRFAHPQEFARVSQAFPEESADGKNDSFSVRDPSGIEVVITNGSG